MTMLTSVETLCSLLILSRLVICSADTGTEEVSGGRIRGKQSGIAGIGRFGVGVVQPHGLVRGDCRMVKTRRACKIVCGNGKVERCTRG